MPKTNGGHRWIEAYVEFFCPDEELGVALVGVEGLKFLPRVGDTVMFPHPDDSSKRDFYDVTAVYHNFGAEMAGRSSEARLIGISIDVKRSK